MKEKERKTKEKKCEPNYNTHKLFEKYDNIRNDDDNDE